MAERRMFAKSIIDSDMFIDLPATARLLYFDLSMRADDDGFVNSPKKILRMTGASQDDLRVLISKQFIIPFDSGVVVIKHWYVHNYIRPDRYHETVYQNEKKQLVLDKNIYAKTEDSGRDTSGIPTVDQRYTNGKPTVDQTAYQRDTQVRLELGKVSVGEVSADPSTDVCDSGGVSREEGTAHTATLTREDVEREYKAICDRHGVTERSGFVDRFMSCYHRDVSADLKKWVLEDIQRGEYSRANKKAFRPAKTFQNFESSGTDWDNVADRVMEVQEMEALQYEQD